MLETLLKALQSRSTKMVKGRKLADLTETEKAGHKLSLERCEQLKAREDALELEKGQLALDAKRWWLNVKEAHNINAPELHIEDGSVWEYIEAEEAGKIDPIEAHLAANNS